SEMLSSDASASIEINPVHHCTPYDQQLPVSPYPCKGLHPEAAAKRPSKDAGRRAVACILRGSALRAEHLRVRCIGATARTSASLSGSVSPAAAETSPSSRD